MTNKIIATLFYEPAFQIGLDMLKKLKQHEEIALALLHEGQLMKSLDIVSENSLSQLKMAAFQEGIEKLKSDGYTTKAELASKRILELKKLDELKLRSDKDHKLTFIDWVNIVNN